MKFLRCSGVTEMPPAVRAQEGEIESMLRNLLRSADSVGLHYPPARSDDARGQGHDLWIFVVLLIVGIVVFCVLLFSTLSSRGQG